MLINAFLMFYYLFFIPLIMLCIFAFYYRYGFKRAGLKSAFKRCILWTISSIILLIFVVFYSVPSPADATSAGPGDGIVAMLIIFPGLVIITFISYMAFMCGYVKAIPEGYISKNKSVNIFMVLLGVLCLSILLIGALITSQRAIMNKPKTHYHNTDVFNVK